MKKILAAALIALSTTASAGSLMENYGSANPPEGYARWCAENGSECDVNVRERRVIPMTEKLMRDMKYVDRSVNELIDYSTDMNQHGVEEYWSYPYLNEDGTLKGDCEDFAVMKRQFMVDRGYPHRAMRIAAVFAPNNEYHAVLVIRTTAGDYVLDMYEREKSKVLLWNKKPGYVWVKMESQEPNDKTWVSLGRKIVPR